MRFPRDWFGPPEELVPFGLHASATRIVEREPPAPVDPDAFWGEDSSAIHDVVQAPRSATAAPVSGRGWPRVRHGRIRPIHWRTRYLFAAVGAALACSALAIMGLDGSGVDPSGPLATASPGWAIAAGPDRAAQIFRAAAVSGAAVVRHSAVHQHGVIHRRSAAHHRPSGASPSGTPALSSGVASGSGGSSYTGTVVPAASAASGVGSGGASGSSAGSGGTGSGVPAGPQGPGAPFGPGHLGSGPGV